MNRETWQHTPSYTIFSIFLAIIVQVSVFQWNRVLFLCYKYKNISINRDAAPLQYWIESVSISFHRANIIHSTFNRRAFCNAINNYTPLPINWSFSVEWVSKLRRRKNWRIRQCISGQFHQIAHLKKERRKEGRSGRLFCYMLMKCSSDVSLYKTNVCRALHIIYTVQTLFHF